MSFLDKIKSLLGGKEKEIKSESSVKIIGFDDIPSLLIEKSEKVNAKEAEIKERIEKRIKDLDKKLNEGIGALERLDLDKRKEDLRLKAIVKENSYLYSSLVIRLLSKLKEIYENKENKEIAAKFILERIALNLNEFYRNSNIPFQKSTIFIGQEMENIRKIIKDFADEMVVIEKENEPFFREYDLLKVLKNRFSAMKELEKQEESLISLFEEQKKKENKENGRIAELEKEINSIKEGKEYMNEIRQREDKDKEIEKQVNELRAGIDFKGLGKKYHSIEKTHKIIKKYSANFNSALIDDKELEFEDMLEENKKGLLKELRKELIRSSAKVPTKSEERIKSLEDAQKNIKQELKNIKLNVEGMNKRKDKLISQKDKIKEEIKILFTSLSIEFRGI